MPNKLKPDGLGLDEPVDKKAVIDELVLETTLVVVDVSVTGKNSSGRSEIAPAPKCLLTVPKTASVELTNFPRKALVWSLAASSFAVNFFTSVTNADTVPSVLTDTLLLLPCKSTTD